MNRDGFTCCACGCGLDNKITLNVHHIAYKPNTYPWDYSNQNLVTLCEKCHKKVHDGVLKIKRPVDKIERGGFIYYKHLFVANEELSPNEGMVYSTLLLYSQIQNKDFYSSGTFSISSVEACISEYGDRIPYYPMPVSSLMKNTEMTFPTIKRILVSLQEKGYINQQYIRCTLEIVQAGYIKMPYNTGLKGRQLIFYAFLLDRSHRHNGAVDTWAYRFKEFCGIEENNVYFLISKLKEEGLVERLDDGRLKINKRGKLSQLPPKTKEKIISQ